MKDHTDDNFDFNSSVKVSKVIYYTRPLSGKQTVEGVDRSSQTS